MKFYTFFNVPQLFYKGFYSAELMRQYLQPEKQETKLFFDISMDYTMPAFFHPFENF